MITAPNRLQELLAQDQVTGIDYVYVHPDQQILDVYFLRDPLTLTAPLVGDVDEEQLLVYGAFDEASPPHRIPLSGFSWEVIDAHQVLRLETDYPGDFTLYKLRINDDRIDPFYNDIIFSFKANCPSDLDCKPPDHECPPEEPVDFPINYLARDFRSFRRALLDFASQRYPDWNDRLEADAGVMLAEVMSGLADEMAYYQDRAGLEAYLETATQRRSLQHHARLIDYIIHHGTGASSWLDITVEAGPANINLNIPAGLEVWAASDSGQRIYYEVGRGLAEIAAGKTYSVDYRRNTFEPHIRDKGEVCLGVGTTSMYIKGHQANVLTPFDDLPEDKDPGKWVLLQTTPGDPSIASRAHRVRLIEVVETIDPVFNEPVTRIMWEDEQALPFEINMIFLNVRANLVPVTAGRYFTSYFVVGAEPADAGLPAAALAEIEHLLEQENHEKKALERAIEREGHDKTISYLYSLPGSDTADLVWLGDDPRTAVPDIRMVEMVYDSGSSSWTEHNVWQWRRSLLGASSQSEDLDYSLEPGTWQRVKGYQRKGGEVVHKDYASDAGMTIRFGDNEFGKTPDEKTVFKVKYRLGGGKSGNISPQTITGFTDPGFIEAVSNPLTSDNGKNPESPVEIRRLAPEAFRTVTYRAVRPEDYTEAAERLYWVQRAGTAFRWTGSWLSAFVTPDPKGSPQLSAERRRQLGEQLDRFRQAGREAHVSDPLYASIDLEITVCVARDAFPGEVKEMIMEALFGRKGLRPEPGYFSPDNFTFGTPLERSTLEAAIQSVSGVRAVDEIMIKRRGWFDWREFNEFYYDPGKNSIIQVENDLLHPEKGTLKLIMEGGA